MEYTCNGPVISVKAYAKINLYLDITGKLPDGRHSLETVMHTVSLHDSVEVDCGYDDISVTCSDESIPCGEKNIAYKAAVFYFSLLDESGISHKGAHIHIKKNIPSQAGMGGGSADAAAVIFALNRFYGVAVEEERLILSSAKVGADVPFCYKGGCGFCTGVGEIIEPLPVINKGVLLIAKGSEGVSTKEAFEAADSLGHGIGLEGVKNYFSEQITDIDSIKPYCRNIFDEVTNIPDVLKLKRTMLENGAVCSEMTGSGSAVFGIFRNNDTAVKAKKMLGKEYFSEVCSFI